MKIIRFKSQNDSSVFPMTVFEAVISKEGDYLSSYITEYNVSSHHDSSAGTDEFTMEEAIMTVPEEYRNPRLKIIYKDASTGKYTSIICDASAYSSDVNDWKHSGDDIENASEYAAGLMSPEDKVKLDHTPDEFTEISDASIDDIID